MKLFTFWFEIMLVFYSWFREPSGSNSLVLLPILKLKPIKSMMRLVLILFLFHLCLPPIFVVYKVSYGAFQVKASYNCLSQMAAKRRTSFKPIVAWMEYDKNVWNLLLYFLMGIVPNSKLCWGSKKFYLSHKWFIIWLDHLQW